MYKGKSIIKMASPLDMLFASLKNDSSTKSNKKIVKKFGPDKVIKKEEKKEPIIKGTSFIDAFNPPGRPISKRLDILIDRLEILEMKIDKLKDNNDDDFHDVYPE